MKITEITMWLLLFVIIALRVGHLIHWLWLFFAFIVTANYYLIFTKKIYFDTFSKLDQSSFNKNSFNLIAICSGISYSSVIIFLLFYCMSWPGTIAIGLLSLLLSLAMFIIIVIKRRQNRLYQSFIVRGSIFLVLCLCFIIIEFFQTML